MSHHKDITPESFLACNMGPWRGITHEKWIQKVKQVGQLPTNVPKEIADAFEVCLGTIMYGWLYYPLMTVGLSKLYTLRETMARTVCQQRGASKAKTEKFAHCIDCMSRHSLIEAKDVDHWQRCRDLRNDWSHPDRQYILPPGHALAAVEAFVTDARLLFQKAAVFPQVRPNAAPLQTSRHRVQSE